MPGTVAKWRRRFAAGRLAGLTDAPRSGRPPVHTAAGRAEAITLASALPAETGVSLSRWSCPELAADALKPWQHQSWISVRHPQFAAKAARVLDLYAAASGTASHWAATNT